LHGRFLQIREDSQQVVLIAIAFLFNGVPQAVAYDLNQEISIRSDDDREIGQGDIIDILIVDVRCKVSIYQK
jgi:hypothetical protein